MKDGRTLKDLAAEIKRQSETKRDFTTPAKVLRYVGTQDVLQLDLGGANGAGERTESFGVTDLCHEQIASRLAIPKQYYDRMRDSAPALLAENVNHWFGTRGAAGDSFLVRTLDGRARALLSDRYRQLDNWDLALAAVPVLREANTKVVSCELTERRLYIKAVTPRIEAEVKKGDVVQSGLVISNSEIGLGSVRVEPMVYRLVCSNGMIMPDFGIRKFHIGRAGGDDMENAMEFFRDETREADDKAFWMKVQDVIRATVDSVKFSKIIERLADAALRKIEERPDKAVEVLTKRNGLTESEGTAILQHLIEGGDLSQWGLANAVTRASQDVLSYDRATELERLGGQIIELPKTEWAVFASKN